MGQVPEKTPYLIVGNGRLTKHIKHYFDLLGITYLHWFRGSENDFQELKSKTDKILVLIKDDEIENFILQNKNSSYKNIWIHCSGHLSISDVESAHPLMTFADKLYDLETYKQIPFISEKGKISFPQLFPELKNKSYAIESSQKALYHAWCVMSGNFTTILWSRFFDQFNSDFGIDKNDLFPYLNKITQNLQTDDNPLTGPLVRNDKKVINENITALKDDPFSEVYKAFVNTFDKIRKSEKII